MKLNRQLVIDMLLACGVVYATLVLCAILFLYIPSIGSVSLPKPDSELIGRIERMAIRGAVLCSVCASVLSLCLVTLIRRRKASVIAKGSNKGVTH